MSRKLCYVHDETIKYVEDNELKNALKNPENIIVFTKSKIHVKENIDGKANDISKEEFYNTEIENIFFELKEYIKEKCVPLLENCKYEDFLKFLINDK